MVTEMNKKVSFLKAQIQVGLAKNREAATSPLEKDAEITLLNSNIVNATITTQHELARMVTCHALANSSAAEEFHAYKSKLTRVIKYQTWMEETIVLVDSKNRAFQVIINNALLSLQSFHADLQAQPRSCLPCLPRKIKTRDVIERISKMCHYPFTEHC